VDFSRIRYSQCWEDADVLLAGLDIRPGDRCLSIASAGDNTLALLTADPGSVVAIDLNATQLHCLELRMVAFDRLEHADVLGLLGIAPHRDRRVLYRHCRERLSRPAREFWDGRPADIEAGIGTTGKFESYFELFRRRILPLVHTRCTVRSLFEPRTEPERRRFYSQSWNSWRWRLIFHLFFSRRVLGRLGRDPALFRYVDGAVAPRIFARATHSLTALDPLDNPYLQWILLGRFQSALPTYLRPESFEKIRGNLGRIELRQAALEDFLGGDGPGIDRFNLSDVFEYMSEQSYLQLLDLIVSRSNPGGRLAYWNLFVERRAPDHLPVVHLSDLARELHARDKAFFYDALVLEEVQ
jgi:S-adenosylmethionine-diacylglycerol 3-amino-3-carboxypropyl transferase